MNTYLAKTKAAEQAFQTGEFEHEFTAEEEQNWVSSGLVEIVPRTYRVLVDGPVHGVKGTDPDPTFEAALLIEQENALTINRHIERVDDKPVKKRATGKEA